MAALQERVNAWVSAVRRISRWSSESGSSCETLLQRSVSRLRRECQAEGIGWQREFAKAVASHLLMEPVGGAQAPRITVRAVTAAVCEEDGTGTSISISVLQSGFPAELKEACAGVADAVNGALLRAASHLSNGTSPENFTVLLAVLAAVVRWMSWFNQAAHFASGTDVFLRSAKAKLVSVSSIAPSFDALLLSAEVSDAAFFVITTTLMDTLRRISRAQRDHLIDSAVSSSSRYAERLPKSAFSAEAAIAPVLSSYFDGRRIEYSGMVKEAMGHRSIIPVGIRNVGNTCFANSMIQAIYRCNAFCHQLVDVATSPDVVSKLTSEGFSKASVSRTQFVFGLLMAEIEWMAAQPEESRQAIDPEMFISALPAPFHDRRQHDASEFSKVLLDALDISDGTPSSERIQAVLKHHMVGSLCCEFTCQVCSHRWSHQEVFWDFPVPVPDDGSGTVASLLQSSYGLQHREALVGDEMVECEDCKCRREAYRRTYFRSQQLPRYLLVQLNRFTYDVASQSRKKITAPVRVEKAIDVENLLAAEQPSVEATQQNGQQVRLEDQPQLTTYTLTGAVIHKGPSPESGHYTSAIKGTGDSESWFLCNDSVVTPIDGDITEYLSGDAVNGDVYVAIYELGEGKESPQRPAVSEILQKYFKEKYSRRLPPATTAPVVAHAKDDFDDDPPPFGPGGNDFLFVPRFVA